MFGQTFHLFLWYNLKMNKAFVMHDFGITVINQEDLIYLLFIKLNWKCLQN